MDDWDAEVEPPPWREIYHQPAPDPEGLERFADVLERAERPAIVAGAWVDRQGAFYDAVALAEKLKAAVWEAPISSRAGFPGPSPLHGSPRPSPEAGRRTALGVRCRARPRSTHLPVLPLRSWPRRQRGHPGAPDHRRPR